MSFDPFSLSLILYEGNLIVEVHPNLVLFTLLECLILNLMSYICRLGCMNSLVCQCACAYGWLRLCLCSKSNNKVIHSSIFERELSHCIRLGINNTFRAPYIDVSTTYISIYCTSPRVIIDRHVQRGLLDGCVYFLHGKAQGTMMVFNCKLVSYALCI